MGVYSNPQERDAFASVFDYGQKVRVTFVTSGESGVMISGQIEAWDGNGVALTNVTTHGPYVNYPSNDVFITWATGAIIAAAPDLK